MLTAVIATVISLRCFHPRCLQVLEREFFIDELLVRIQFIIGMIWRTSLAPWEFESLFLGSLISTFLASGAMYYPNPETLTPEIRIPNPTNQMKKRQLWWRSDRLAAPEVPAGTRDSKPYCLQVMCPQSPNPKPEIWKTATRERGPKNLTRNPEPQPETLDAESCTPMLNRDTYSNAGPAPDERASPRTLIPSP